MTQIITLGGHRGAGCTDHSFYQDERNIGQMPVENTLDSFALAFQQGAGYVELDAVPTRDGKVITIHNVVPKDHFSGEDMPPQMLNQMDYRDIARYSTGRFGKGQVPLLCSVFDIVARHAPKTGDVSVNVELKGGQGSGQPYETCAFLENVARIVRDSAVPLDRVLFSSFSFENILRMSYLLPGARFGMLFNETNESAPIYADHQNDPHYRYLPFDQKNINHVIDSWRELADPSARLRYAHPETATITAELVAHLAERGMGINAWDYLRAFDDQLVQRYKAVHGMCQAANVPVTFITDYIPEMKHALQIG